MYLHDAVQRIVAGDIVLLRRALQSAGLWDEIQRALWSAAEEALGSDNTERLREMGLGRMHELLTGDQIKEFNAAAHSKFNSITAGYVPKLVREAVGRRKLCDPVLCAARVP